MHAHAVLVHTLAEHEEFAKAFCAQKRAVTTHLGLQLGLHLRADALHQALVLHLHNALHHARGAAARAARRRWHMHACTGEGRAAGDGKGRFWVLTRPCMPAGGVTGTIRPASGPPARLRRTCRRLASAAGCGSPARRQLLLEALDLVLELPARAPRPQASQRKHASRSTRTYPAAQDDG